MTGWKPRDDQVDAFGLTHKGLTRPDNQDHFLLCSLHKAMHVRGTSLPNPELLELPSERLAVIMMVADGVAGSLGGEEASRATIEAIATYITHTMQCYYRADPSDQAAFFASLSAAAEEGHAAVVARAKARGQEGMATTLTMGIGVWPVSYTLHVGDSRAYQLRDGVLTRLTRDQTMGQELVDAGALRPSDLDRSPFSHVLSSAIGTDHRPVVIKGDLRPGDVNMFCTDGLTKHVSDAQIRDRLVNLESAEQACRALVNDALAAGGTDNVTVVIARPVGGPK
jgi:protein phosphatase